MNKPADPQDVALRPVKVLIVEDSEDDAAIILRTLKRSGFDPTHRRVQTAVDMSAALAAESWDAVLSDFNMPDFTGMDALGILRSTGLDIPFILISATIGEETAVEAMKAGASDYVMKKSLALLAPALERELGQTQRRAAHRQAQRDLVESERRLRTIIETEPECVKVVSPEGALLEMNTAGLAMLEADSLAQAQSQRLLDFVVPEHRAAFAAMHQRVIRGESASLEFEVIGFRGGRRWLETHAAPLSGGKFKEVMLLGITRDITARKRGDEALRRFSAAMDATSDAIYLVDRASMRFVHVNEAACRMQGRTREEVLALGPEGVLGASRADLEQIYDTMIASGVPAKPLEMLRTRRDGTQVWVELRRHAQASGEGWTIVTLVRDITERKAAETRIQRLSRVHAVLSSINTLIVRAPDRDELFREACRIAVEQGQFKLAWVGLADLEAMKVVPIASAGAEPGFLERIQDRYSLHEGDPSGRTLTARAIIEKKSMVSNDIRAGSDPRFLQERLERGIASIAVLPLLVADKAVGVLCLYAGEAGFFDAEEMRLLTELSGDISFAMDHIEKQERLEYLAYYDVLTGLANRSLFLERAAQSMRSAARGGHRMALFIVDLERFRSINDTLGRAAGDALLKKVTEWLVVNVGEANLLARVGADHFAVLLPEVRKDGNLAHLIEKAMDAFLEHPFHLEDAVFRISSRVGIALFPDDGAEADTLFRNAETALKKAKARGERYVFYKQKMTDKVAGKLTLENQLRQALDEEQFVLHYQPKADMLSGKLAGAEALIRWNDPRTGLVPPGRFIPVLEETGMIHDVGRWALRRAIADFLRWRAAGLPVVRLAVNVSPLQLRDRGFIADVGDALGVDAHAPAGLELEITESLIMEDVRHSIASLQAIRAMKVGVAIDDFGTGFSSLSYLARLPADTLKIDRSFVIDMTAGPKGLSLVSTIINLAHSLKLKVVAEGVETEEQSRLLRLLTCDEMQGYLVSRPLPAEEFEARFLGPK